MPSYLASRCSVLQHFLLDRFFTESGPPQVVHDRPSNMQRIMRHLRPACQPRRVSAPPLLLASAMPTHWTATLIRCSGGGGSRLSSLRGISRLRSARIGPSAARRARRLAQQEGFARQVELDAEGDRFLAWAQTNTSMQSQD